MGSPDDQFLNRAFALAMQGRGNVEPNPMVGCVIVKNDRIIGEGIHAKYGGPHAEPTALAACTEDPKGATAYVTLEPCCHLNKQTPPCAPRLIEAGISRVVIGCLDPNPEVNGKGVAMLQNAGILVDGARDEPRAKQLIAAFIARTVFHRPYVTLKWAQTADGKVAGPGGRRMRISNERSNQIVHRLRARCDAILVGINTVLNDDPMLTARDVPDPRPIVRCVLDRHLRTPPTSNLARTAREFRTIVACDQRRLNSPNAGALRQLGVELLSVVGIEDLLKYLHGQRVSHLLVEPGPTLAEALFRGGFADRLWLFDCAAIANDVAAMDAPAVPTEFRLTDQVGIAGDTLREHLNTQSDVFFAASPSADLTLEMNNALSAS